MEAIHHSEERYASLTLVTHSQDEIQKAREVVDSIVPKDEEITISESEVDDIYEITIEYHDDYDKKSGDIFNEIIQSLNINQID